MLSLIHILIKKFQLKNMTPDIDAEKIVLTHPEVNRPALQLAGFFDHFDNERVQIIGNVEQAYISAMEHDVKIKRYEQLVSSKIPCMVSVSYTHLVTCPMESPMVMETEASRPYVTDMAELVRRLKEDYGLYVIARVVAFRDPWLAEKKPEWCLKLPDGTVSVSYTHLDVYKRQRPGRFDRRVIVDKPDLRAG